MRMLSYFYSWIHATQAFGVREWKKKKKKLSVFFLLAINFNYLEIGRKVDYFSI